MKVAELFAVLGIKVDKKSFANGQRALSDAVGKAQARLRDAQGRYVAGTAKAVKTAGGQLRDAQGRFVAGVRKSGANWQVSLTQISAGLARVAKMATMAGAAAAAFATGGGIALSDSYTSIENRIRQVSSGTQEMNELMDKTRAIANATRSDWKATGEAFVRLKNSTKDLGLSTERALNITGTLNMALQSSGASAAEAAAGTLQLMQGLASGALQGDEFRSIAEQLPDLLDVFAKEMGVSRGELKKLGSEGKITAKVVVAALESASGTIRDKFIASTATAAQGWTVLKNNLTVAAAEFVRSSGLMDLLGSAVQRVTAWIEANRDEIQDFAKTTAAVVGTVASAVAATLGVVMDVIGWFREGSDEATAIMIAIASLIVTIVVPALYAMAAGWVAALWPIVAVIAVVAAVVYAVRKLIKHWDKVKAAAGVAWDWIKEKAVAFLDFMKGVGAKIAAPFIAAWEKIKSFGSAIAEAVSAPFRAAVDFVRDLLYGLINFFIDQVNWLIGKINWLSKKASKIPGIDIGRIELIDRMEASATPGPVLRDAAVGPSSSTITNTLSPVITINGAVDPNATAAAVDARMRAFWDQQMRLSRASGGV